MMGTYVIFMKGMKSIFSYDVVINLVIIFLGLYVSLILLFIYFSFNLQHIVYQCQCVRIFFFIIISIYVNILYR